MLIARAEPRTILSKIGNSAAPWAAVAPRGVAKSLGQWRTCWGGTRRVVLRVGTTLTVLAAVWLTLTIHPQPLFAYSLRQDNLVLYARALLPEQAGPILRDALRRVAQSPLYNPARRRVTVPRWPRGSLLLQGSALQRSNTRQLTRESGLRGR